MNKSIAALTLVTLTTLASMLPTVALAGNYKGKCFNKLEGDMDKCHVTIDNGNVRITMRKASNQGANQVIPKSAIEKVERSKSAPLNLSEIAPSGYGVNNKGTGKNDLQKYCSVLAKQFSFASELNSMARQASAERAWSSINRFYENCKKGVAGRKGFPRFQKNCRSVEYKTTGWKLADNRKSITFSDKKGIGRLKLKGTRDLHFFQIKQIKRVRLVKRADGFYVQFCIDSERRENITPTGNTVGLDVGLKEYYTDSNGEVV